ncbi:MAG: hypothetical protein MJ133_03210 [Lachnospiraceae bacterium]|nr:hypothetical protein [Lachnospiraceae bacterium]
MFCSNCGNENTNGNSNCAFCGAPLVYNNNMAPQQNYGNNPNYYNNADYNAVNGQNYDYGNVDYNAVNGQNYDYGNAGFNAAGNQNYNYGNAGFDDANGQNYDYGNADYNAANGQNYDYGNNGFDAVNNQNYDYQNAGFAADNNMSPNVYGQPMPPLRDDANMPVYTPQPQTKSKLPVIIACASVLLVAIITSIILICVLGDDDSSSGTYTGNAYGSSSTGYNSGSTSVEEVSGDYDPLDYDELLEEVEKRGYVMAFKIDGMYYIPSDMDSLGKFSFDQLDYIIVGNNDHGNRLKLDFSRGDAIIEFTGNSYCPTYQVYEVTGTTEIFPCKFSTGSHDDYVRAIKYDYNGIEMPNIPIEQITEINGQPCDSVLQNWENTVAIGYYQSVLPYSNSQSITFGGYNGSKYETVTLDPEEYKTLLYMDVNHNRTQYSDRNYFIYENRRVRTKEGYSILMDKDNNAPDNSGTYMFDRYMIEINL